MSRSVKNIIFDFGGVIIPIDPMAYVKGMEELGCTDVAKLHGSFLAQDVYTRFERGELRPEEFRALLRKGIGREVTDVQLDRAWNMIIGDIPEHRVKFLESIRTKYRTFLLSNTNEIHYDYYQAQFARKYGYASLDNLFEKAYYSFRLHMYKPDPAIFQYVLHDSNLIPEETLFIDDFKHNVEAAKELGLHALHLVDGMDVVEALH